MKAMSIDEIRRAVRGAWISRGGELKVASVSTDTRTSRPGELFLALKGPRHDAHEFLAKAAEAGCLAAIVRRDSCLDPRVSALFAGGIIGVSDTTEALGELAACHRRASPATVIAVTGSNGKTTVKRMIHHILSTRHNGTCGPKSFNNAVGVPLTLLAVGPADDYVVCELGTSAPGEIAALTRIVRPNIAVITSVSPTHLERLGSLERVAAEKAAILAGMADDGMAVVTADCELLQPLLRAYEGIRIIRFGVRDAADLRLTGYEPAGGAQRFQLNGRLWVRLRLSGRHNALNAIAAIAAAQRFGFQREAAAEALADFEGVEMRLQPVEAGGVKIINDAYNANPASVLAAAEVLAQVPAERRVLIVADMLEMGEQAERIHLQTGRDIAGVVGAPGAEKHEGPGCRAAPAKIDLLIGVGELGRYIATGAAEEGMETDSFKSVEQACRRAAGLLKRGDAILIKGSRAMAMERLIEPIRQAFGPQASKRPGTSRKGAGS